MADDKLFTNKQGEAGEIIGNPQEAAEEARNQQNEAEDAALQEAAKKLKEEPTIDTEPAIDNDDLGIFGK